MPERDPSYEPGCLFCRITAEELPSSRVYEDEAVIVFRDINPRAPTHFLAITRRHIPSVDELDTTVEHRDLLAALFAALRTVAADAGVRGYRIVTNVGPDAGQSVFHLHFHLLAGRTMLWPPG